MANQWTSDKQERKAIAAAKKMAEDDVKDGTVLDTPERLWKMAGNYTFVHGLKNASVIEGAWAKAYCERLEELGGTAPLERYRKAKP